jgi:hypothetical protein
VLVAGGGCDAAYFASAELYGTAVDEAIDGLVATNDSPTPLGQPTMLAATVSAGTNIVYTWDFGNGAIGWEAVVSHTYLDIGVYTATVTAANSVSSQTATTVVTIADAPIAGLTAVNDSPTLLGHPTAPPLSARAATSLTPGTMAMGTPAAETRFLTLIQPLVSTQRSSLQVTA